MSSFIPDKERLEQEWAADQDVLQTLRQNGDNPALVRSVDVSFRGTREALEHLAERVKLYGLEPTQLVELDDGEFRLDTTSDRTTDEQSIRALTVKALQIEAEHQVIYDGWGCVAAVGELH